jgi:asparagine synthase (glutamine-hydrolysing)
VKALLALSFGSTLSGLERSRYTDRARTAVELFADAAAVEVSSGDERVLVANPGGNDLLGRDSAVVSVMLTAGSVRDDGSPVDSGSLVAASTCSGDFAWERIVPPFAAVVRRDHDNPLVAATDTCGIRHLFFWQGAGVAAVASSAVVLGAAVEAALDEDAIATWALSGMFVGERTAHQGVRKLLAGMQCELMSGRIRVRRYCEQPEMRAEHHDFSAAVHECARALADAVSSCVEQHPHTTLELSAGIDSRGVLAAIPERNRSGVTAVTLATPDGSDEDTAAQIAALMGLPLHIADCAPITTLALDQVEDLVRFAAKRRGFAANPLAACIIDYAEARFPLGPRLTGQNGEFGRGVYTRGVPVPLVEVLPARGKLTDAATNLILEMRFFANARVDEELLVPGFLAAGRRCARPTLHRAVGHAHRWGAGLDEMYLGVRMQHWAGTELSVSSGERVVLAPYFHPAYLRWARRAQSRHKQNGVALAGAIAVLDPILGAVPINGGFTPEELGRRGLSMSVRRSADIARRATKKLPQRIARREKAAPGASDLGPLVLRAWAARPGALARLEDLPFLRPEVIKAVASGNRPAASASVGFLLDLDGLLEFREAVSRP